MRKYVNGQYLDITEEEIRQAKEEAKKHEIPMPSYDELVDYEIRKKYSVSQEFAILRQRDEKPEEYAEYYAYCEECKARVKERIKAMQNN